MNVVMNVVMNVGGALTVRRSWLLHFTRGVFAANGNKPCSLCEELEKKKKTFAYCLPVPVVEFLLLEHLALLGVLTVEPLRVVWSAYFWTTSRCLECLRMNHFTLLGVLTVEPLRVVWSAYVWTTSPCLECLLLNHFALFGVLTYEPLHIVWSAYVWTTSHCLERVTREGESMFECDASSSTFLRVFVSCL